MPSPSRMAPSARRAIAIRAASEALIFSFCASRRAGPGSRPGSLGGSRIAGSENNSRGDVLRGSSSKDELGVGGRSFQGLEQGVERLCRQHVNFVDDVDLVSAGGRQVLDVLSELADIVDLAVGGAVDFDDVKAASVRYLDACGAFPARVTPSGPYRSFRLFARMRAVVVLPTPRGPQKR